MTDRCGYTRAAAVIESNRSEIAERELETTQTLLARNTAGDAAVDLVGEPVLAGNGIDAENTVDIIRNFLLLICGFAEFRCCRRVSNDCLGRVAEHIGHSQINSGFAVFAAEVQTMVIRSLAYDVQRSAFALGYPLYERYVFRVDYKSHALLALVAYDFFI